MFFIYIAVYLILFVSVFTDIKSLRIPYSIVASAGFISTIFIIYEMVNGSITWSQIAYALLPGIALIVTSFITRQSVGYGDGLMMLAVGPIFGSSHMVFGVCLAFFISAIFSLVMMVFRKADNRTRFPFMPFLTVALGVSQFAI